MDGPQARATVTLLVPHPKRPAMLTTTHGTLPTAVLDSEPTVRAAQAAFEAQYGPLGPVLRYSTHGGPDPDHPDNAVLELESIGPKAPARHRWADFDDLDSNSLKVVLRQPVKRWMGRQFDGPAPLDPPWSHRGWFGRASSWMIATMTDLGAAPAEPPRVFQMWAVSTILWAPSAAGTFFLKCSAPMFRTEAEITAALARATPDFLTPVVAVEPAEGWLLMRDLGQELLGDRPPSEWGSGLAVHAAIQQAWSGRVHELLGIGVPDRRLRALAAAIPSLLASRTDAMPPDDRTAWGRAIPELQRACLRLDELGPPPTLVHGDLHPWNVAIQSGVPRVFDWTDAAVSHPFVDLATYVGRGRKPEDRRAIVDAYLDAWASRLPPDALSEAAHLAMAVGCVYQVQSYLGIYVNLDPEDTSELHDADLGYAKGAVAALREGIDAATSAPTVD